MKFSPLLFLLLIVVAFGYAVDRDYKKIHFDAIVADTHNDVLQRIMQGEDISVRTTSGHSDLVRWKEGGLDIQMFSVWVPPEVIPHSYERANAMIDSVEALAKRNPDKMGIARNSKEIEELIQQGKLAALYGMEGAHPLEDSTPDETQELKKLEHFYQRGVRYITLTWNNSVSWATSAKDETDTAKHTLKKGLTKFGERVIRRMNELGIMVDVSHVGEKTFWDVLRVSTKPVIASHSSVYNLCPHRRNLKDDQLKALAKNGGVVFINFNPPFIDSTYAKKEFAILQKHKSEIDSFKVTFTGNAFDQSEKISEMFPEEMKSIRPSLTTLIDHIDYVAKLIGVDHVGIGSDFDGITNTPSDMEDVTKYPNITRELLLRGYSEDDVKKILGGNFMRVFKKICG